MQFFNLKKLQEMASINVKNKLQSFQEWRDFIIITEKSKLDFMIFV